MIVILGPTASGKTAVATTLAKDIGAEIISADSRQVYRDMNIGTGKDLKDYNINGEKIPYHLIDIKNASEKYNLFDFQQDFYNAYNDITTRGKRTILCGGTGLYIEAILKAYSLSYVPQNTKLREKLSRKNLSYLKTLLQWLKTRNGNTMHNKTDVDTAQRAIRAIEIELHNLFSPLNDRKVTAVPYTIIGIDIEREDRRRRISERLKDRLEEGMVDEVTALLNSGIKAEDLIYYGLEYKYITEYIIGIRSYKEMCNSLEIAIHQFAKRQMTWFRGMERRGLKIHWVKYSDSMEEKIKKIKTLL